MNNIIKQAPLLKVLKPDEVIMLNGVYDYKLKVERENNELLNKTKLDYETMVHDLELSNKQKLEELSDNLYKDSYQQLDILLNDLEQNLYPLIGKILNKLQINSFSHQQISNTIKNELYEVAHKQDVTIQCNSNSLEQVKLGLADLEFKIRYQINDNLQNEQCILNTGLSSVYIDLADCRSKIMDIFTIANDNLDNIKKENENA